MIINIIFLSYFILCVTVMIYDMRYRIIPNIIIKIIFALGTATSLYQSHFIDSSLIFILSFIVFFCFWYLGFIGGGDVKAICVFALAIKPDFIAFYFILIGILGAIQVFIMIVYDSLFKKVQMKRGIPYGIPISISSFMLLIISLLAN